MIGLACVVAPAIAQSMNIDINSPTGAGSGVPSSSFGAAASMPGVWNSVAPTGTGPFTLVNLAGSAVPATLSRGGAAVDSMFNSGQTSGDHEKLLDDYQLISGVNPSSTITITGLIPGAYQVFTYANGVASSSTRSNVNVFPTSSTNPQVVGGTLPSNAFVQGTTHSLHNATINTLSPNLIVTLTPNVSSAAFNGLQLRLVTSMAPRLYVDANATGGNNGSSWADAFTSLQSALSAATASGGVTTEIWVADGVYKPTTTTDRTASFNLINGVSLIGGFAGGETSLSQRDPVANKARLSGLLGTGSNSEKSYQIVDASNTNATAVLDGFWIENGNCNGLSPFNVGAGVYCVSGSPTIRNCTFNGLMGTVAASGMYSKFGSPTISHCRFVGNTATGGPALFHIGPSSINVVNCLFAGNIAGDFGGAVQFFNSSGSVTGCVFTGNVAALQGGAVYLAVGSNISFANCSFANNSTPGTGGGIYLADDSDATIANSIFWANTDTDTKTSIESAQFTSGSFGSFFTLTANAIQGWTGLYGGSGNFALTASPFVDADGNDNTLGTLDDTLTLAQPAGNACIDAGRNPLVPADATDVDSDGNTAESLPRDAAGNPRFADVASVADAGVGASPVVDLGAYEVIASAPPPPCAGDVNNDRLVNGADLSVLLTQFGTSVSPVGSGADFNKDGLVNGSDLSILLARFGTSCTP